MTQPESSLPPLNWLRAFESSARHLSFTSAASELNMTQSAVSQQIKNLEQHLGRALFIRRTRSIQLTDAGLAYLPVVQEAFDTLVTGTRMMTGGDRGKVLNIQANMAFSVFWLAPRLGDLMAIHPWLKLNISSVIWDTHIPNADVEIRFGIDLQKNFNATSLGGNTAYPVCTPDFAATLERWQDAHLFDCTGVRANWESWAAKKGEKLPSGKLVNLASTYSVSINAALGNAGLSMGHEMLTGDLLAQGMLIRPYEEAIPMDETYYVVEPAEHDSTPATRAFCEWIKSEIA
ncbi:MAG: LysR family transcriptional regulator [Pseudomonadota bacterium]